MGLSLLETPSTLHNVWFMDNIIPLLSSSSIVFNNTKDNDQNHKHGMVFYEAFHMDGI